MFTLLQHVHLSCHFDSIFSILYLDLSSFRMDRLDSWGADGWWQPPSWICGLDPAIRRFWGAESSGHFFFLQKKGKGSSCDLQLVLMMFYTSLTSILYVKWHICQPPTLLEHGFVAHLVLCLSRLPLSRWLAPSRRAPWSCSRICDVKTSPRCWKISVANRRSQRSWPPERTDGLCRFCLKICLMFYSGALLIFSPYTFITFIPSKNGTCTGRDPWTLCRTLMPKMMRQMVDFQWNLCHMQHLSLKLKYEKADLEDKVEDEDEWNVYCFTCANLEKTCWRDWGRQAPGIASTKPCHWTRFARLVCDSVRCYCSAGENRSSVGLLASHFSSVALGGALAAQRRE